MTDTHTHTHGRLYERKVTDVLEALQHAVLFMCQVEIINFFETLQLKRKTIPFSR